MHPARLGVRSIRWTPSGLGRSVASWVDGAMTTIPGTAATTGRDDGDAAAGAVRGHSAAGQNGHGRNGKNGRHRSGLVDRLIERVFAHEREYAHFGHMVTADGLRNFVFAADDDGDGPTDPLAVF